MKVPLAFSLIAALAGGVLGVTGVVVSPGMAAEGGGVDPGSIQITRDPAGDADRPLTVGDSVRVTAAWSVPDGTVAGHRFTLELPDVFSTVNVTPFALETASGESMGECAVTGTPPVLACTLNSTVEGKSNVHGALWAGVRASKATDSTSVDVVLDGGQTRSVPLPGGGGIVPRDTGTEPSTPAEPTPPIERFQKWGENYLAKGEGFWWKVAVPSSEWPDDGTSPLTIVDRIGEGSPHRFLDPAAYPGPQWAPYLEQSCDADPDRYPRVVGDRSLARWTVSPDGGTMTVEVDRALAQKAGVEGACAIRVNYITRPTGEVRAGDTFRNSASVNRLVTSSRIVLSGSGGGTAEGDEVGRFSVAKSVTGAAAALVAPGTEFHARYRADGYEDGTLNVAFDGTEAVSPWFRVGTRVLVGEVDLPVVPGVEWGDVRILVDGVEHGPGAEFVIAAGRTMVVELVNTADPEATVEVPVEPEPEVEVPGEPVVPEPEPEVEVPGEPVVPEPEPEVEVPGEPVVPEVEPEVPGEPAEPELETEVPVEPAPEQPDGETTEPPSPLDPHVEPEPEDPGAPADPGDPTAPVVPEPPARVPGAPDGGRITPAATTRLASTGTESAPPAVVGLAALMLGAVAIAVDRRRRRAAERADA